MTIRVLLADDQELIRAGFASILGRATDIEVVGEASTGHEAVLEAERLHPDVVVMDIRMPDLDGIEATRRLCHGSRDAGPHVLIVTTYGDDENVYRALAAGASGFLLKDASAEELIHAVRVVAEGNALLSPAVTRGVIERFTGGSAVEPDELSRSLTPREHEVLALLVKGLSNAEIAQLLVLSEPTVKTHVAHILDKLDLRSRVQAVAYAFEHGLA